MHRHRGWVLVRPRHLLTHHSHVATHLRPARVADILPYVETVGLRFELAHHRPAQGSRAQVVDDARVLYACHPALAIVGVGLYPKLND